ncbi:MAG: amidase [Trueperaceae bacterium]|nr:MAG: amidase [Trueperaceae bacterium]
MATESHTPAPHARPQRDGDAPLDKASADKASIVAALTAHAGLRLDNDERERLEEYVDTVWEMATRLRQVDTPGLEGLRSQMPLRAAYANRAGPGAPPPPAERTRGDHTRVPDALLDGGLTTLAHAVAGGDVTPSDVTHAVLERIERFDGAVRSYITVDREGARAAARALDAEIADGGPRSVLHGVPIGAKDSIPIAGMACTYNSPLMRDWVPKRDAEAIRRLRAAGAVMIGKHNLNEFGWSLPTEDDLAPPPRNPWFPAERSVGSTSGGGAAVAAGLALAAIGTDGGGSIRLPAGQHLLFGVKPGHDDVPRQGVGEGGVSEVSVLTRTAPDAAAVLAAMQIDVDAAGAEERLRREPAERAEAVLAPIGALRIGVPEGYLEDVGMEDDVASALAHVRRACAELGIELVGVPRAALDILHDAVRANFVVIAAEHFFDHEGPGADRSRYGESAGFYNLPGSCLSAADYLHALRVGGVARAAIDAVLGGVDMLLTPTSPVTRTSTARNPKTHRKGGNAAYTAPFNISGHPALSFPAGISAEGIPIGMQLVGRRGSEFEQLRVGHAVSSQLRLPAFPDMERVVARVHAGEVA